MHRTVGPLQFFSCALTELSLPFLDSPMHDSPLPGPVPRLQLLFDSCAPLKHPGPRHARLPRPIRAPSQIGLGVVLWGAAPRHPGSNGSATSPFLSVPAPPTARHDSVRYLFILRRTTQGHFFSFVYATDKGLVHPNTASIGATTRCRLDYELIWSPSPSRLSRDLNLGQYHGKPTCYYWSNRSVY